MSVRVLTISAKFKLDRDFKQKLDLEVTVFDKIIKVNRHFFVMFVRNFLDIAQDKIRLDSYQVKKKNLVINAITPY